MKSFKRWDIHPNGHCFHPSGLDVYLDTSRAYGNARCVLGPYSRNSFEREGPERVAEYLRDLVGVLEKNWFEPEQFTLFGVESQSGSGMALPVLILGAAIQFSPNPTLRTMLWDKLPDANKASAFEREWIIDRRRASAYHSSGLKFQYLKTVNRVCAQFSRTGIVAKSVDVQLIEVLAEQGFAALERFSGHRLFCRFDIVEVGLESGQDIAANM